MCILHIIHTDYMSYDELFISALCGVSSPTHFINDGDRRNHGRFTKGGTYPLEGIYMALIGARFEKEYFMEHSLMAVTANQNTSERGYGQYNKKSDIGTVNDIYIRDNIRGNILAVMLVFM